MVSNILEMTSDAEQFGIHIKQLDKLATGIKKAFDQGEAIDLLDLIAMQFLVEELMDYIAQNDTED